MDNGPVEGHINRLKTVKRKITEGRGSNFFDPEFCR
jgi:transposase